MTSPEPRRRFNLGVWKLPYELRTLIHAIFDELDPDLRNYLNILGADTSDFDEQFPVGSAVTYSVELTEAEAAEVAAASNLRYLEEDWADPPARAVGRPTGTAPVPTLATFAHMRARYVDLRRWHGRDVPVAVLDQGTTAAVREKMGWTLLARTVTGGVKIAPGEEIGRPLDSHDHGCLVAPNAVPAGGQLLDCVIVEDNGTAFVSAQAAGIRWAVDNGAKVVNLSFAGAPGTPSQAIVDAADYAAASGVQIVISAGNDDLPDLSAGSSMSRTKTNVHSSIAFNESTDRRALFSNHHADGSGCAAGVDVASFDPFGNPVRWNGTSASAPHMAQLIARGATGGTFTAAQVAAALRANARDTGAGASEQGAGAWDLQRALAALGGVSSTPTAAGVVAPSVIDAQGVASNGAVTGFTLTAPGSIVADDVRIVIIVASVNAQVPIPPGWTMLFEEHYYAGHEQGAGQTVGPTAVFVLAKPYVAGEPEPAQLLFGSTWFSALACLTVRAAGGLDPERFSPQVRFGTGSSIPTLSVLPATTNDLLVCVFTQRQATSTTGTLSLPSGLTQRGFWRPSSGTTGYPLLLATAQLSSGARTASYTSTSNDAAATWCSVALTIPSGAPAVTSTATPGDAPGSVGGFLPFYPVGSGAAMAPVIPAATGAASGSWSFAGSATGDAPTPGVPMVDATNVSFTGGGATAPYHFYGAGLPGNGSGLVVYLHGDGDTLADTYEFSEPTSNYALSGNRGLIAVAKAKGYALAVPRTPDTSGSITWWENSTTNNNYLAALIDHLVATYQLDRSKIWLMGYSGGAGFISENFMPTKAASKITGGGAVIVAGGDAAQETPTGWTAAFKAAFPMHWVAGQLDDGTFADDGFNAIGDAQLGRSYYQNQGFTTTITTPPAMDHDIDGMFGPILDDYLPTLSGFTPPSRTPGTTRPTLITSYLATATGTSSLVTPSFTPAAGEVIVVKAWGASQGIPVFGECTGGGLTFASKAHVPATGKAEPYVFVGEVGATSPGSMTVTMSWHTSSGPHGMIVERWSSGLVHGLPAQSSPVSGSGAPSASITPSNANSVITWLCLDKSATSGTATYRSGATQTQSTTATIRAYAAYQNSTGTGAQTVGLSAPSGQNWTLAGIELLPGP